MEGAGSPATLTTIHQTARHHLPEIRNLETLSGQPKSSHFNTYFQICLRAFLSEFRIKIIFEFFFFPLRATCQVQLSPLAWVTPTIFGEHHTLRSCRKTTKIEDVNSEETDLEKDPYFCNRSLSWRPIIIRKYCV